MNDLHVIFGSCPTCHTEFGHAYPYGSSQADAREALGAKIKGCTHNGLGAPLT